MRPSGRSRSSPKPRWISIKALMLLHQESLAEFGGAPGMRDETLLKSALARPQNAHSNGAAKSIPELAAAYAFGIIRNRPFIDGNKRAAFLSIGLFLAINGYSLHAGKAEATRVILALASGDLSENELAAWIGANCSKLAKRSPA